MSEIKVSNFRSNYYQKLGSTCGVEEKKSLGILLNNNVVDIKKIEQFCLRYHVPADFRCQLWKILLSELTLSTRQLWFGKSGNVTSLLSHLQNHGFC